MVVLRDESCVPDENGRISADTTNITDAFDVELTKKPSKGLGLSIVGRKSGSGIFISDIVSDISRVVNITYMAWILKVRKNKNNKTKIHVQCL